MSVSEPISIDFSNPAYFTNPYPMLAEVRSKSPVHQHAHGYWLLSRHADIDRVLRSGKFGKAMHKQVYYQMSRFYIADSPLEKTTEEWMFFLDPPEHTRIRSLFHKAFTPKVINRMRDDMKAVADELIDSVEGADTFDFMPTFAQRYPVRVISKILDLPDSDFDQLKAWSDALTWMFEVNIYRDRIEKANEAVIGLEAYFREHINQRRKNPGEDLLGQLIAVEEQGDRLTEHELVSNLVGVLFAGHETTTNLIGNGLLALIQNPDQIARLRSDFSLLPTAVEEFMRYNSPVNALFRIAYEDSEIDGHEINEGAVIICLLGAANHDPDVFENPETLDIGREPNPHVSFGGGVHYCPGAPLSRIESQIAFERILSRWSHIEADESGIEWRTLVNLRGMEHLPLRVT